MVIHLVFVWVVLCSGTFSSLWEAKLRNFWCAIAHSQKPMFIPYLVAIDIGKCLETCALVAKSSSMPSRRGPAHLMVRQTAICDVKWSNHSICIYAPFMLEAPPPPPQLLWFYIACSFLYWKQNPTWSPFFFGCGNECVASFLCLLINFWVSLSPLPSSSSPFPSPSDLSFAAKKSILRIYPMSRYIRCDS